MADSLALNRKTTAVVAMDFQNAIVGNYPDKDEVVGRMVRVLDAARRAGLLVIHVVVGLRPGMPEVSPRNKSFTAIKQSGMFSSAGAAEIDSRLTPLPDDFVVRKPRVGAFMGTDLEVILRSHDIDTLVIAGVSTSGCVLSTVRHGADADYGLVVIADCCADRDPEVHRVLTEKLFPRQATVTTADALIAELI